MRADLDGDGTDEVVIVTEHLPDTYSLYAKEGDYSVVLVRRVDNEQVHTIVLASSVAEPVPEGTTPFITALRIAALADLNGDGTMEVAVQSHYYEGSGVEVYEATDGGAFTEVLSVGCGA